MTIKEAEKRIDTIATDLALTNNSFYTAKDIPQFKKRLTDALIQGGWKEVERVKLKIKYA
jgi:hypothetical protein